MVFSYKESDLRDLNLGRNVYSVNPDYAKKINAKVITASPEKKNETNVIKTEDGKKFKVLKTSPVRKGLFFQISISIMVQ